MSTSPVMFSPVKGFDNEELDAPERERAGQYMAELVNSEGKPTFKRPFYLLPLWRHPIDFYKQRIVQNIIHLERKAGELTSRAQRQLIGGMVADTISSHDAGRYLGVGFALFMTLRKRKRPGVYFPLVGPVRNLNPNQFPPPWSGAFANARLPPLRGRPARLVWGSLTFLSYFSVTWLLAFPTWDIYVNVGFAARVAMSPLIREITHKATENLVAERQRLADEKTNRIYARRDRMGYPQHRPGELPSRAQPLDPWAGPQYPESSSTPTGQPASPSTPQPQARGAAPAEPQDQQSPWESTSGLDASVDSAMFDDASPVAQNTTSSRGGRSPATSWDEIRRRNTQGQQPQQAAGQPPPSGSEAEAPQAGQDQYTYGESDKTKAQREFDAMLEAERKGSGGNSWKRW